MKMGIILVSSRESHVFLNRFIHAHTCKFVKNIKINSFQKHNSHQDKIIM